MVIVKFFCLSYNKCYECTNVVCILAKGIGALRQDKKNSQCFIKQMPMGTVEYIVWFDNLH